MDEVRNMNSEIIYSR